MDTSKSRPEGAFAEESLISKGYRDLNRQLHAGGRYGFRGDKWAPTVRELVARYAIGSILDYGCGRGSLAQALDFDVCEYDPAIPGKDGLPEPADLVVCTDVMEHVEPELLANVLDHLQSLTLRILFVAISTRAAVKHLADGRNAHLIVEPPGFWEDAFRGRFETVDWKITHKEVIGVLSAHGPGA